MKIFSEIPNEVPSTKLLDRINYPEDLKKLSRSDLKILADELREFLLYSVGKSGGHLGAGLGVVELTIVLHYLYDSPSDNIVWDVGHQAYPHKILTGRKDQISSIRSKDGLAPFPSRNESDFDAFGAGHSSTSISSAVGMAIANKLNEGEKKTVAVIGDGAMTAGMAFEGINHAGFEKDANLLVVLNDNGMSIEPSVGALREYSKNFKPSQPLGNVKEEIWKLLGMVSKFGPDAQSIVAKISKIIKGGEQNNLFESLNFQYFGPVDGHDVARLAKVLNELKDIPGPKILHCITRKGAGYKFSEEGNPVQWHAPGIFNKETGEIVKIAPPAQQPPKYQDVFGHTIVELAERNEKIMGITPAMPSGCSLNIMMKAMPDRTFDVGIAEQHAVTFSAGLAVQGLLPFCNIYSSFMQRAYDQVLHDVAIQNLNVVFCLDRAGLVGADGATHHGAYDLAYMRCIPNMIVSAPMNEEELRNLMFTAQLPNRGPFTIRYPRGRGVLSKWKTAMKEIQIGKGRRLLNGNDIAILSVGHPGNFVAEAAEQLKAIGVSIAHYDMRFVKPIDELMLHEVFTKFKKVITVEDGCIMGGFGSAVIEFMADQKYQAEVVRLGVPDKYIHHGTQKELWSDCGYDADGIIDTVIKTLSLSVPSRKLKKNIS